MATSQQKTLTANTATLILDAGVDAETQELFFWCELPIWLGGSSVTRDDGFLLPPGRFMSVGKLSATETLYGICPNQNATLYMLQVANESGGGAI